VLLCLNEALVFLSLVSRVGFYARISEPRIAGTYMTLVSTIGNLGKNLSSTLVLYIANWLPRPHVYSIEVGACFLLGFIWISFTWHLIRHLDELPVEKWYLEPSVPMSMPLLTANSYTNITESNGNVSAFNT
jgi:PAT family acetyl-CoA transporter-like MFS transporter 1